MSAPSTTVTVFEISWAVASGLLFPWMVEFVLRMDARGGSGLVSVEKLPKVLRGLAYFSWVMAVGNASTLIGFPETRFAASTTALTFALAGVLFYLRSSVLKRRAIKSATANALDLT